MNKEISVVFYANGFTLWHIDARKKTIEDIYISDTFNKLYAYLSVGDKFIINAKDGYCEAVVTSLQDKRVWVRLLNKLMYEGE